MKRCPLGMSGLRCFVVGSGKGLPVALSTPVPWHHPAVGETEAWRGWTGSAGVGLHSQGCCILQESWRRAEGEPLATTPSLLTFGGGGKAGGVPGVLLRAGRASPSLLAEPAAQGRKRKQERGGVGRENVNSTGPGAWLAASPAGSPPCGPPPGRLPPAPHCWGLPTFAPGSPSTEHLLAQQGRDWAAPGVAGESRVLSIAT